MHLIPAYGRDYKNKAAIAEDLRTDRDFTISDISSPYDGAYVNRSQLEADGVRSVTVRYAAQRKVAVFDLSKLG